MFVKPSIARPVSDADRKLDPARIYEQHADFVWRSLQRCGLSSFDLEDAFQEVFVVVHTRLDSFKGDSKLTTWLFGICLRVAKKQRRFSFLRSWGGERSFDVPDYRTPEGAVQRAQSDREVERVLGLLSPEQRAVFTMFELEHIDCTEIAETMGVPVGTIYSRLHAARIRLRREVERADRQQKGVAR